MPTQSAKKLEVRFHGQRLWQADPVRPEAKSSKQISVFVERESRVALETSADDERGCLGLRRKEHLRKEDPKWWGVAGCRWTGSFEFNKRESINGGDMY